VESKEDDAWVVNIETPSSWMLSSNKFQTLWVVSSKKTRWRSR